jgi:LAO/AO transport system kinase
MARLRQHAGVAASVPELEAKVRSGDISATLAARRILEAFARNQN